MPKSAKTLAAGHWLAPVEWHHDRAHATAPDEPPLADRDHKAEIVDRLYDVALDPIRLEDLLEVWEGSVAPLRVGPVERAIPLEDPEIEAHLRRATVFLDRYDASARGRRLSVGAGGYSALCRVSG